MTYSQIISTYLAYGTHASRPTTPNVASGVACLYYETDTGNTFLWTGAWTQVDTSLHAVVTKSASYTITAADIGTVFVANAASLVFTLPAPAAAGSGFSVLVKNNNQTTTGVKTNAAGVTIDGVDCSTTAFTTGLTTAYGAVRFICDGSNWYTISQDATGGGGSGSLELTDGTTDLTSVTKITVSGLVVGGSSAAATLTAKQDSVKVHNSANQSCANNTETLLTWDTEDWDTNNLHSTSSNTSRLTCQVAGKYLVCGTIEFAENATGFRQVAVRKNGTDQGYTTTPGTATDTADVTFLYILDLAVNDYVEVTAMQNSGGALNVDSGAPSWFSMTRLNV